MKTTKFTFAGLLFMLFFVSCQSTSGPDSGDINAEKLKELIGKGTPLIDVRTPSEFQNGYIKTALNIDFRSNDFLEKISEFDKDQPLILYCGSGGRSGRASDELQAAGFKTIYDYTGGFSDWKSRGEDIVMKE